MKRLHRFFAVLMILLAGVPSARAVEKPNIIFILADDMGWQDAACYGHPYAKTPNIDSLAAKGTRFTQCYATGVTCCPSRTGFMTGKFPATFAKYPAGAGFGDRVTVTELLKKQGYATGHFGKWHIGPETKPGTYGIDLINVDEGETGGKKKAKSEDGRDARIYDRAIRFIEEHKEGPFYINIWDHIVHHPVNPSKAVLDAFGPLNVDESKFPPQMGEKFALCKQLGGDVSTHMRAYLAELKSMDDQIGELLNRLDQLGLRDKTMIVFSSDQGPANPRDPGTDKLSEVRLNAMGCCGPFRGGKHSQHEGGVRIPLIVSWPGHVPVGRVDEKSVLCGVDWLPTLCTITGVKIDTKDFDGEDASAAWLGNREQLRAKPIIWKTSAEGSVATIREGQWKYHAAKNLKRGEVELFDLASDPGESNNLADKNPDVVRRLATKLNAWVAGLPKHEKNDPKDD